MRWSQKHVKKLKNNKPFAKALQMYKGAWYSILNNALRSQQPIRDKVLVTIDDALQSIMQVSRLKTPILYRSLDGKFGELVSNMEIGDQFTDTGYSSTSLDLRSALNFDSDELTLLLISIDTNCKWTYIDAFRDIYCKGKWVHQFEVLLNKNTTFTVTKKERRKQVVMFKDAIDCGTPILSKQWIRAVHVTASRKF